MNEASPHGKRARRGLCHRAAEWGAVGELVAEGQEVLLKTALITCSFASRPNSLSHDIFSFRMSLYLSIRCAVRCLQPAAPGRDFERFRSRFD